MNDDRLRSGHLPLDEVLGGGLPANGISIIMGLPGTGKTIIAQQYAFYHARPDRPAVYFSTLSEPLEKIVRFGQTLDFFDPAAVGRSVFYENLAQVAGRDGLGGVSDHVAAVLRERRPGLVVIDSFKALHVLADSEGEFRQFLHQLAGRLTAFPAGALWVGEYGPGEAAAAPEFAVADAIIELAVVPFGQREKRFLNVRKLRGSGFRSGRHGYRLSSEGLHLFPRLADIPAPGGYPADDGRITSGIPALDAMLGGGLWPGSCTMIAGPSGSGKTITGLHFLYDGARQGQPGVIATLQENPAQLNRLLDGLGWPPGHPAVEVMYRSPVDIYIDEWVHDLLQVVERTQARRVLIDSLLDLQAAAEDETRFREFMYSLAQRFSRQGITLLATFEAPDLFASGRFSESAVSHLADNGIMLNYHHENGAMSRSLAVVKTRASRHDLAMRQFSIGPDGISLGGPGAELPPVWPRPAPGGGWFASDDSIYFALRHIIPAGAEHGGRGKRWPRIRVTSVLASQTAVRAGAARTRSGSPDCSPSPGTGPRYARMAADGDGGGPLTEPTQLDFENLLAFRVALRRFQRWSEDQASAVGLTHVQHQLLVAIKGHPGRVPPSVGQIADYLLLQSHSAVGLVDRAAAAGFVRRSPDPDDARVARVELTETGDRLVTGLAQAALAETHKLAAALSALVPAGQQAG